MPISLLDCFCVIICYREHPRRGTCYLHEAMADHPGPPSTCTPQEVQSKVVTGPQQDITVPHHSHAAAGEYLKLWGYHQCGESFENRASSFSEPVHILVRQKYRSDQIPMVVAFCTRRPHCPLLASQSRAIYRDGDFIRACGFASMVTAPCRLRSLCAVLMLVLSHYMCQVLGIKGL